MSPEITRRLRRKPTAPAAVDAEVAPFTRTLAPRPDADRTPVTDILFDRLTENDIAEVHARLTDEHRWMLDNASPAERRRTTLSFGLLYEVPSVIEHTGLSPATPPPEVHSMVHGWVTEIGGSYYLADMVYDSVREIGRIPGAGARVLDFSCSSGRVVRPLAAALPEVEWHGCDPNAPAIEWMSEHVPAVHVQVTPNSPPLAFGVVALLGGRSVDLVGGVATDRSPRRTRAADHAWSAGVRLVHDQPEPGDR
jgi:hypothetical protein